MKIAVPTKDNVVDNHFGHCDTYTIFDVDEQKNILAREVLKWSHGCGCKSNIVATLKEMGVEILLAGNMGQGALNVLLSHNMEVVRGCSGNSEDLVREYLNGNLTDTDILCSSHRAHH